MINGVSRFFGSDFVGLKPLGLGGVLQEGEFQDSMLDSLFGDDDVKMDDPNPCIAAAFGVNIRRMNDMNPRIQGATIARKAARKKARAPTKHVGKARSLAPQKTRK